MIQTLLSLSTAYAVETHTGASSVLIYCRECTADRADVLTDAQCSPLTADHLSDMRKSEGGPIVCDDCGCDL